MKTYAYSVTVEGQGNQHIINTDNIHYAIHEFIRAHDCGCSVCVCNGATGEVLCHNGEEPYCTDEMGLMVAGYLAIYGDESEDDEKEGEDTEPSPEEVLTAISNAVAGPLGAVMALLSPDGGLDVFPYLPPDPKGLPS